MAITLDDIHKIEDSNKLGEKQFRAVVDTLFNSFTVHTPDDSEKIHEKKEIMNIYLQLLNKTLASGLIISKEEKLSTIKFVSWLNMQVETYSLISGESNLEDLKKAGKHLGRKSQSAFGRNKK
jgi:hypothetical protein